MELSTTGEATRFLKNCNTKFLFDIKSSNSSNLLSGLKTAAMLISGILLQRKRQRYNGHKYATALKQQQRNDVFSMRYYKQDKSVVREFLVSS
jgi:hypothetical protein